MKCVLTTLQQVFKKIKIKSRRKQINPPEKKIHYFTFQGARDLLLKPEWKGVLFSIAKLFNLSPQKVAKTQIVKKQLAISPKVSDLFDFVKQVLNFTSVLSDDPLGNTEKMSYSYSMYTSAGKYLHVSQQFCLFIVLFLFFLLQRFK